MSKDRIKTTKERILEKILEIPTTEWKKSETKWTYYFYADVKDSSFYLSYYKDSQEREFELKIQYPESDFPEELRIPKKFEGRFNNFFDAIVTNYNQKLEIARADAERIKKKAKSKELNSVLKSFKEKE